MSFYSNLATTAVSLLTKFGQNVTLRKTNAGAYDASAGSVASTPTDSTLKGALFDFPLGTREFEGTLVEKNDKYLLLAANGAIPSVDDAVIVGGVQFTIIAVKTLSPAGTTVLYTLHLR